MSEQIGVLPFLSSAEQARGSLRGFVISGRWPDSTKEWAQVLVLAVRVASLPGILPTTTVFVLAKSYLMIRNPEWLAWSSRRAPYSAMPHCCRGSLPNMCHRP